MKSLGNKSFNDKENIKASDFYLNGICIFRFFCPVKKAICDETTIAFDSPGQLQETRNLLNVLFLNLTACYLNLQKFDFALLSVEESLKLDSNNDKAWFRKAKALEGTGNLAVLPEAIDCLELALRNSKTAKDESYFKRLLQEMNDKFISLRKSEQKLSTGVEGTPLETNPGLKRTKRAKDVVGEATCERDLGGVSAPSPIPPSK